MSALGLPWDVGFAEPLQPVTVRRTRNGKVAHLFVEYTNGAISGLAVPFCEQTWSGEQPLAHKKGWRRAGDEPLCNRCGRAFRAQRREWRGLP